jgi:hypothetical protein
MKYVDAGYGVVLGILFLYGFHLWWRQRRLVRLVTQVEEAQSVDRPSAEDP